MSHFYGGVGYPDIGKLWAFWVSILLEHGQQVRPRDQLCLELTDVKLVLEDASKNILVNIARNPSYRFMVAEWLWIWFGHDDVKTIVQYNKNIAQFSDDGIKFHGAYGPPIRRQWSAVKRLLEVDPDTRQAVLQIYQPPSAPTKDVPCTLSLQFLLRQNKLGTIATMRSSDVWLGLPYDMFNFSMLANIMAGELKVEIGSLTMNLGSSHLYERDFQIAEKAANHVATRYLVSPALPGPPPEWLNLTLETRLDATPIDSDPTWHRYRDVLLSASNTDAFTCLHV